MEVVDMVLRIREKLDQASGESIPVSRQTCQHLQVQLKTVLESLPEDLQSVLQIS